MSRFDRLGLRRFSGRDAVFAVLVTVVLLVLFEGASVRKAGEEMKPGIGRDIVLGIGRPAGWIADRLPLAGVSHAATAWLSPNPNLSGPAALADAGASDASPARSPRSRPTPSTRPRSAPRRRRGGRCTRCWSPATRCRCRSTTTSPSSSSPGRSRDPRPAHRHRHLEHLRRRLGQAVGAPGQAAITPTRSWSSSAPTRASRWPDRRAAARWSAAAPTGPRSTPTARARWPTPTASRAPRGSTGSRFPPRGRRARQNIARVVNAAIGVAAQPWADQVRVIDTVPIFTPGTSTATRCRSAAQQTIVREADGIHLNDAGSSLLAGIVLARVAQDFKY